VSEICDAARGQRRAALRRSIGCPILREGYYGLATFTWFRLRRLALVNQPHRE